MTIALGIAHIVLALIIIGISIPLTMEKVPMNQSYGVRIPIAFESEENWYKVNRYGGKALILWSIPAIVIGIGLIVLHFKKPISPTNFPLVILFTLTPLIFVASLPQTLYWAKHNLETNTELSLAEQDEEAN